jgi:chloramphenicol 3-O-phosphotransferase
VERRPDGHFVFLITGPPASGKSTIGCLLARLLEPGVHLEGDFFRRSVVSGRHEMTPDPSSEAIAQLHLRYTLTAQAADAYSDAGFNVVVEDVVAGPFLAEVTSAIRSRPLHVVVLLPSVSAIAERDSARDPTAYSQWTAEELHEGFAIGTPRIGLWLDNTNQSPEETVDAIVAHFGVRGPR